MLTLGIDPGTATTGYGLVRQDGKQLEHVSYGCILTASDEAPQARLGIIYKQLKALIVKYSPDVVAVERLFFGQNTKTAMAVGQARGIVLLAAAECGIKIAEYTPLEVKLAITGYGKAEKKQIQQMVRVMLRLEDIPKPDDAADALAVAITHLHSYKLKGLGLVAA
jgi:crossover junction endodeoxyribonuclease RuvC